jgi:IclR family KDG regulon transcriptional repressor
LKPAKTNYYLLQSVQNGLRILQLFSVEQPVWGITEIANALQLNKSTVSRLIGDLVMEGYLEKEGVKYRLGFSLLCLSGIITSSLEIHREATETLKDLAKKLGETAHISILEDSNITYLHKVECKHPVRLLSHIGKKNPATCTSSGKVLLAFQTEEVVREVIAAGLPRMGPNSVTDPEELLRDLLKVRQQGYSVCIDEMHDEVVSIGAPVRDYTGQVVAAVSVAGPRQRVIDEKIPRFINAIIKAGKEISIKLGYIQSVFCNEGEGKFNEISGY